jgi:SpoVK/Ycf46/Vps4 family AAA+-type ATPase
MANVQQLTDHLRAGFANFWLSTFEPDRLEEAIHITLNAYQSPTGSKWTPKTWKCTGNIKDPVKALESLNEEEDNTVLILHNFQWFLEKNKMLVQIIQDQTPVWASQGKAIAIISSTSSIPLELQKYFCMMEMDMPSPAELEAAMYRVTPENRIPDEGKRAKIVAAARGLTMTEAENVFALSLIQQGELSPVTINDHKAETIAKSGFLEVIPPTRKFDSVIGYDLLKTHMLEMSADPRSKGALLIGHPGTAKTSLCYALIGETNDRIGIKVSTGKLFSKYIGESDANVDFVIKLICALGNCYVILDEFEKQFAGVGGAGEGDSGTTKRSNSRWLEFLQDRPLGISVYGTANSFVGIPPEYLRPGRWDTAPFFVGFPNPETQKAIFKYYMELNGLKKQKLPDCNKWTGSDIEACCSLASIKKKSLIEASQFIIPQAKSMKEKIMDLENWAKDRTIPAEEIPNGNSKRKLDIV